MLDRTDVQGVLVGECPKSDAVPAAASNPPPFQLEPQRLGHGVRVGRQRGGDELGDCGGHLVRQPLQRSYGARVGRASCKWGEDCRNNHHIECGKVLRRNTLCCNETLRATDFPDYSHRSWFGISQTKLWQESKRDFSNHVAAQNVSPIIAIMVNLEGCRSRRHKHHDGTSSGSVAPH